MYLWSSLPGFCIKLHNYVYIEFLSIYSKLYKLHTYYANKINYAWIECHPTIVNYVKQAIFLAAYKNKKVSLLPDDKMWYLMKVWPLPHFFAYFNGKEFWQNWKEHPVMWLNIVTNYILGFASDPILSNSLSIK